MLDLFLVGVRDAHAGNCARIGASAPHLGYLIPGGRGVLHLGPDEVIAGAGDGAIDAGVGDIEQRATGDFLTRHQLGFDRIPELGAGRRVESRSVLPGRRIERTLIDGVRQRRPDRAAVLAGRSRQWRSDRRRRDRIRGLRARCRSLRRRGRLRARNAGGEHDDRADGARNGVRVHCRVLPWADGE